MALFKQHRFQQVPQDWSSSQAKRSNGDSCRSRTNFKLKSDEQDSETSRETLLTVLLLTSVSV